MMLLALLLAAAAQGDWFRAVQYAPAPAVLRGCAECQGEADDACEVRAGLQMRPLDDYARQRWPAAGRIKLMRSNADPDCSVPARSLFAARSPVELAAIRLAPSPPQPALLEQVTLGPAVSGWPRRSPQRKPSPATAAAPDRAALRTALVCWPSEKGWPSPIGADARATLTKANLCEWWLAAVRPDTGEPDPAGASFPIALKPFAATTPQWAEAFDPALPLEDALLRQTARTAQPASTREADQNPDRAPAPAPAPARAPAPAPDPDRDRDRAAKCGDAARSRSATLDRFDQWDRQIRNSPAPSLDRASFSLDAAAWSGHCQELDVLRAALERQLGCAAALTGECSPAAAR